VIRLRLLSWYVFKEIAVSFVFAFAVFLVAGLIAGFLPLLQKAMETGLTLILFQVLLSALPGTLVTILPLSMMIGILLGLGRLAADNEIAAMKSAGISVLRLAPPVTALAVLGLSMSFACTLVLIPKGITEGRRLMQEAATKRADAGIEERTFFDAIPHLILYVESIDHSSGVLNRVFLRESSKPDEVTTIMAQRGKVSSDPEGKVLILDLRNGTIVKEDRNGDSTGQLAFETYVFRFPLNTDRASGEGQSFEELPISDIRRRLQVLAAEEVHAPPEAKAYYRRAQVISRILIVQRFVHPLACLALAVAAFPLGVLNLGKSRLNNVSLGLIVVFVYYAFTLATERAARSAFAPPELVLPLPPLVFICAAAYFARCVEQERFPSIIARWRQWTRRS
jgi:lipopolysaccharide export system permease protein